MVHLILELVEEDSCVGVKVLAGAAPQSSEQGFDEGRSVCCEVCAELLAALRAGQYGDQFDVVVLRPHTQIRDAVGRARRIAHINGKANDIESASLKSQPDLLEPGIHAEIGMRRRLTGELRAVNPRRIKPEVNTVDGQ